MPDQTTGEALAAARDAVGAARVADPDEHFPYKLAAAEGVLKRKTPMGPDGPKDASVTGEDFTSRRIVEATAAYVAAQEAYLLDGSAVNREAFQAATDDLVAARRAHRRTRVDANGNPALNVTGQPTGEGTLDHLRGTRFRRPGEE